VHQVQTMHNLTAAVQRGPALPSSLRRLGPAALRPQATSQAQAGRLKGSRRPAGSVAAPGAAAASGAAGKSCSADGGCDRDGGSGSGSGILSGSCVPGLEGTAAGTAPEPPCQALPPLPGATPPPVGQGPDGQQEPHTQPVGLLPPPLQPPPPPLPPPEPLLEGAAAEGEEPCVLLSSWNTSSGSDSETCFNWGGLQEEEQPAEGSTGCTQGVDGAPDAVVGADATSIPVGGCERREWMHDAALLDGCASLKEARRRLRWVETAHGCHTMHGWSLGWCMGWNNQGCGVRGVCQG